MALQEALGESPTQANDGGSDIGHESDNPELSLKDHNLGGWDDVEIDGMEVDGGEDLGEPEDLQGCTSHTFLNTCWLRLDIVRNSWKIHSFLFWKAGEGH